MRASSERGPDAVENEPIKLLHPPDAGQLWLASRLGGVMPGIFNYHHEICLDAGPLWLASRLGLSSAVAAPATD